MQNTLTAAVLLIGNELLSGSIQDQNLAHIAKMLEKRGIRVRETRIVPDIEIEIANSVNQLRAKYNYVFTTGGIGPTHDDITSDSIAAAFGVKNVVEPSIFEMLNQHFTNKGVEFTPAAQRMAHTPEGAKLIQTKHTIIPAYNIENVYVMAGVPRIMQMMLDDIIDDLNTGFEIINRQVHANVSEDEIAADLEEIQNQYRDIDIGSYPQDPGSKLSNYRVIFIVKGTDEKQLQTVCNQILKACQKRERQAVAI